MLHHCNIDRLISLWQAVHYDNTTVLFRPYETRDGSFGTPARSTITPDSDLLPFKGASGNYLTSEDVTSIQNWGYTYEPIRYWDQSPEQIQSNVNKLVNQLYKPPSLSSKRMKRDVRRRDTMKQYFARISVERSQLPLPASLGLYVDGELAGECAFLATPSSGPGYCEVSLQEALQAPHLVGLKAAGTAESGLEKVGQAVHVEIRKVRYFPSNIPLQPDPRSAFFLSFLLFSSLLPHL
jgi:tyrosinase